MALKTSGSRTPAEEGSAWEHRGNKRGATRPHAKNERSMRSGTAEEAPNCGNGLEAEALVDAKAVRRRG
jgi:hypothetical protein